MSLKRRLRTLLCCVVLELGALSGVPMRPEQIRALMHALNQPAIARTSPQEDERGDPPSSDTSVGAAEF